MQTILGSGGAIGVELAKALTKYTDKIRLVSRNPKKVNPNDEIFSADLMNLEEVKKAVEGSSVVYVTVGFPYNLKVWQKSWPDFMRNVIDACTEHKAKLVFFDNIYMYDPDHLGNLTEETPIKPVSRKGKVRAEIAGMLMDAVKEGKLTALIARSADFYGPGIKFSSMLNETVFKPFKNGKKANWLGPVNYKHSFTYTPDAGIATAMLGNTEDAYGQVWHLPTHENPLTGKEWIENIAKEMGVKPAYMTVPKFMVRILGIFTPIMGEIYEMLYQYDRDYVFRSDKFGKRFSFKPTEYLTGIKEVVKADHPEKL